MRLIHLLALAATKNLETKCNSSSSFNYIVVEHVESLERTAREVFAKKHVKTCCRFLPIQFTCNGHRTDILKYATSLFESRLSSMKPSTMCVLVESRNNVEIDKAE